MTDQAERHIVVILGGAVYHELRGQSFVVTALENATGT